MSLDVALWSIGLLLEIVFAGLLLIRRAHCQLPFFFTYILWTIVSDIVAMLLRHQYPQSYFQVFVTSTSIDSLLQIGVLVELGWALLRPLSATAIRPALVILVALFVLACLFALPSGATPRWSGLPHQWQWFLTVENFCSILRVLLCLVLAGCSQLLALGWQDRELQIATGLGCYSLLTLVASFLHAQPFAKIYWHRIDQSVVLGYLACLLFWMLSFRRQASPSQNLTPRIQAYVAMLARIAHAERMALETAQGTQPEETNPETSR